MPKDFDYHINGKHYNQHDDVIVKTITGEKRCGQLIKQCDGDEKWYQVAYSDKGKVRIRKFHETRIQKFTWEEHDEIRKEAA